MRRLFLICLLALGLAPGTWLRTSVPTQDEPAHIVVEPFSRPGGLTGRLRLTGAWVLRSDHPYFGGFSAMAFVESDRGAAEGTLLIGSDRGWMMRLPLGEDGPLGEAAELTDYWRRPGYMPGMIDLEAMARDPDTGTLWTAYEGFNMVLREKAANPSGSIFARRGPEEMRDWRYNSGPEAMVRLADGRFVVLAEGRSGPEDERGDRTHAALLFERDPVEPQVPMKFRLATPCGFAPTDATALPDGRVLILLRRVRYGVPVAFDAAVMVADPSGIEAGGTWTGRLVGRLAGPLAENFEGIAHAVGDGTGSIYLISDDNFSGFQRTLLLRLEWPGEATGP